MSCNVIGYMLGYARRLNPRFELHITGVLTWQCGKYKVFISGSVPASISLHSWKGEDKEADGFSA